MPATTGLRERRKDQAPNDRTVKDLEPTRHDLQAPRDLDAALADALGPEGLRSVSPLDTFGLLSDRRALKARLFTQDAEGAFKGELSPSAIETLGNLTNALEANYAALVEKVGERTAADLTQEDLGACIRRGAGLPTGEARSLLSDGSTLVPPTTLAKEVLSAITSHGGLLSILPTRGVLGRGVGEAKVARIITNATTAETAEASTIAESGDPAFSIVTAGSTWRRRAARVRMSNELLADAPDLAVDGARSALLSGLQDILESAVANGEDFGFTDATVGIAATEAAGAIPTVAEVLAAAGTVLTEGIIPTHAVLHPATWAGMSGRSSSVKFTEETDLALTFSSALPLGTVLVGRFVDDDRRHAQLTYRLRPVVEASRVSPATFVTDSTDYKLQVRWSLAIWDTDAFALVVPTTP
ncbi:MAG: phage major capsid protein [Acidimicrobiia bacterium]